MLRDGGHLYMVHRPDRLADIFSGMRAAGIEPKDMQLVVPKEDKAANIVLIHGVKGAGPELRMLPQITVHTADGGYTDEILKYYERV
jgi:tRNA1(Val) A37 N6-methylase TrmN6